MSDQARTVVIYHIAPVPRSGRTLRLHSVNGVAVGGVRGNAHAVLHLKPGSYQIVGAWREWPITHRDSIAIERRLAAQTMVREGIDAAELLDEIAQQVTDQYQREDLDDVSIDTVAWLCRALAATAQDGYVRLLKDVSVHAGANKLRTYVEQYLERYHRIED